MSPAKIVAYTIALFHWPYDSGDWQALFALVQLALAAATLFYLKRYVDYTRDLAKDTAHLVREAAQQREAGVMPVLVVTVAIEGVDGTVSVRNIGDHPAFDVQMDPIVSFKESKVAFDRIAIVEQGKWETLKLANDTPGLLTGELLAVRAYQEVLKQDSLTITCKSISNRKHTFKYTRGVSSVKSEVYFFLAQHS